MAAVAQTILPICELSTYHRQWMIKARVTNKAPVREFNSKNGPGKVFHVDLLDAAGGEIRASFFNQGADKLKDILEKGKCYTFSRGSIRIANKQYNTTNHKYELTFDKEALVEAVSDDSSIEAIKFSFVSLRVLQTKQVPCSVDLCGVIASFKPTMSVKTKEGVELVKREITLADDTAFSMTVTLWGDRATQEDKLFEGSPVITLKSVSIKEWQGSRAGSLSQSGTLIFNSTLPEAKRVQQWWSQGGSSQTLEDLSKTTGGGGNSDLARPRTSTNVAGIKLAAEHASEQATFYTVVARLAAVQMRKQGEVQPLHYMACQEQRDFNGNKRTCNKRVDESSYCVSCNRTVTSAPRLNLRCRFVDYEDQAWLTSFHEAAIQILGMSGEEVRALEKAATENGEAGREELEATIRKKYFDKPMSVTVRTKMDMYNGEARSNVTVTDVKPVSYGQHGRHMLKNIQDILAREAQAGA